jgi:hypothetical protein
VKAEEFARCNANHRRRDIIDDDLRPQDRGIRIEPPLPVRPAHDRHGGLGRTHLVVLRRNQAADGRPYAEDAEEVADHVFAVE